ncbi:hypothetical protein MKX08_009220 [Trichoderma sp. CBMAI-0020]|nr:hypothetical protein MKX08_009220 [Trichoderma sp. CBMAI-0020]
MEKDEAAKQQDSKAARGRGAATEQWLRRCGASGAMQLEAEGGGLGRDVCVSSSTAKKTKMLWATLELVGVDVVEKHEWVLGGSGFGRLADRGSGGGYGRAV